MIKGLVIIVLVGALSFFFTDVRSPSLFFSAFLPLVTVAAFGALGMWVVMWLYRRKLGDTRDLDGDISGIGGIDDSGDSDS